MTLENSKRLLSLYEKSMTDSSLSETNRRLAKKNYDDMLNNIGMKESLLGVVKPEPEEKPSKKAKK